jgi:hypothetical protein
MRCCISEGRERKGEGGGFLVKLGGASMHSAAQVVV